MITDPDFLLVYGTLRPPFDNLFAQYLRKRGRCTGEGEFSGQIFDIGSYPGAIYQQIGNFRVFGTVFDISHQKAAILTYLDYYEGVGEQFDQPTEFVRSVVPVRFNNRVADCWIYLYNLSTIDKPIIESGDYAQYVAR